MNAAIVNAYSFTVRGLIAAADAARSLERMASICWPSLPRLMNPTQTHSRMAQPRQTQPKTGDGTFPSMPLKADWEPKSTPKHFSSGAGGRGVPASAEGGPSSPRTHFGGGTGEPVLPPPQVELLKPNVSIATAPARVVTARETPRTRTAEMAVMTPITTATAMPARALSGNLMPKLTAMWLTVNPAAPARLSWITEIWPT